MSDILTPSSPEALLDELRQLIEGSRGWVAEAINSELVPLYWQVGRRLRGFGRRSLYRMMRFAEVFPDPEIVSAVRSQLSFKIAGLLYERTAIANLLFFQRPLRALVATVLKLGRFDACERGQMDANAQRSVE